VAVAAFITVGATSTARRVPRGSRCRKLATERYPLIVEGRQLWSASSQSVSRSDRVTPGLAWPLDLMSSAAAAQRSFAASASSRSPRTVMERTRLRPLTLSGPRAMRTSQTLGARRRNDPLPRRFVILHGKGIPQIEANSRGPDLRCWDACWDAIMRIIAPGDEIA